MALRGVLRGTCFVRRGSRADRGSLLGAPAWMASVMTRAQRVSICKRALSGTIFPMDCRGVRTSVLDVHIQGLSSCKGGCHSQN